MSVKRGDIYYADLSPVVGSEQGGLRPVLIIQNDVGNRYSPTVIAAAITSRLGKNRLPTHIDVYADRVGLVKDSVILLEQMRTLDKRRLKEKMGHLDDHLMEEVNRAIAVSVGLGNWQPMAPSESMPAVAAGVQPNGIGSLPEGQMPAVAMAGNDRLSAAAESPQVTTTVGEGTMTQGIQKQNPAAMEEPGSFVMATPEAVATPAALEMAAELNTQNAASPEFGEVMNGDVVR